MINFNLLAVHIANNICIESKKKNITSNETDAPNGKQRACIVSRVWTSEMRDNIKLLLKLKVYSIHNSIQFTILSSI